MTGCVRQTTKKYQSRPSPPYPANKCCSRSLKGNDGHKYVSRPDKNNVCRWVPSSRPVASLKGQASSRGQAFSRGRKHGVSRQKKTISRSNKNRPIRKALKGSYKTTVKIVKGSNGRKMLRVVKPKVKPPSRKKTTVKKVTVKKTIQRRK